MHLSAAQTGARAVGDTATQVAMETGMAEQAKVVVIGGGVVGCSCLYHLAKSGITDALLIERDELTSGSTWHAAGNLPTFSTSWSIM